MPWLNSTCHPAAIAGTTTRRSKRDPGRPDRFHLRVPDLREGRADTTIWQCIEMTAPATAAERLTCPVRSILIQGTYQRQISDMPLPRFITTRTEWLFRASRGLTAMWGATINYALGKIKHKDIKHFCEGTSHYKINKYNTIINDWKVHRNI